MSDLMLSPKYATYRVRRTKTQISFIVLQMCRILLLSAARHSLSPTPYHLLLRACLLALWPREEKLLHLSPPPILIKEKMCQLSVNIFCSVVNNLVCLGWLPSWIFSSPIQTKATPSLLRMRCQFVDPSPALSYHHTWTRFTVNRSLQPEAQTVGIPSLERACYLFPVDTHGFGFRGTVPMHKWGQDPKMLTEPHNPHRTEWDCEVAKHDTRLSMTFEFKQSFTDTVLFLQVQM